MVFLPWGWQQVLLAFLVFRFFDIIKPWPISWLDRHIKGGLGIMLDDWAASAVSVLSVIVIMKLTVS
jgi:phosphatidylglycerophosphatase A